MANESYFRKGQVTWDEASKTIQIKVLGVGYRVLRVLRVLEGARHPP